MNALDAIRSESATSAPTLHKQTLLLLQASVTRRVENFWANIVNYINEQRHQAWLIERDRVRTEVEECHRRNDNLQYQEWLRTDGLKFKASVESFNPSLLV